MKRILMTVIAVAVAGQVLVAQDANAGKKLYEKNECEKCHQIAGKGNKIGKLDGVASKVSEAEIRRWLVEPLEMEKTLEKKPKLKMSSKIAKMDLKPADIDALVAYMLTLK